MVGTICSISIKLWAVVYRCRSIRSATSSALGLICADDLILISSSWMRSIAVTMQCLRDQEQEEEESDCGVQQRTGGHEEAEEEQHKWAEPGQQE